MQKSTLFSTFESRKENKRKKSSFLHLFFVFLVLSEADTGNAEVQPVRNMTTIGHFYVMAVWQLPQISCKKRNITLIFRFFFEVVGGACFAFIVL